MNADSSKVIDFPKKIMWKIRNIFDYLPGELCAILITLMYLLNYHVMSTYDILTCYDEYHRLDHYKCNCEILILQNQLLNQICYLLVVETLDVTFYIPNGRSRSVYFNNYWPLFTWQQKHKIIIYFYYSLVILVLVFIGLFIGQIYLSNLATPQKFHSLKKKNIGYNIHGSGI